MNWLERSKRIRNTRASKITIGTSALLGLASVFEPGIATELHGWLSILASVFSAGG